MAEELTTAMHEEFIGDEISHNDLKIMGAYGAIRNGASKVKALRKYGLTEGEYDANIDRVLSS